ncbi:MAG: LamG-like jellyroll fold domain-containing protein, partial [Bacteroidales bacterium]|nr:LamG-like jellyroll fold domain-containing protein [Bacteroidales bacterium]
MSVASEQTEGGNMNTIHIKTSVLSVIIFVFTIFAWQSGEAQCNNCATDGLITPTSSNPVFAPAWTTVNVNTIKGNQFMLFNVVKGQIYRWSTAGAEDTVPGVPGINCTTDAQCSGGYLCVGTEGAKKCAVPCNTNAECQTINSGLRCIGATGTKRCEIGFDTELTVLKDACGSSGVVLAYNRNATLMNQSEVEYKADFTGTVYVLVTNYQCSSSCDQFGGNCMTTSLKWQRIDSTFCEDCKNNSGMIVFKETAESLMKYGLFSYGPSTGTEYEATMYRGPVRASLGSDPGYCSLTNAQSCSIDSDCPGSEVCIKISIGYATYGPTTGMEYSGYITNKASTYIDIIQHSSTKLASGHKIKQGANLTTVSAVDSDSKRNISMLYYTVPIATGDKIKQGGESGTVASIVKGGVNTPDTSTWAHTSYDFQKAGDYQIFNVVKGRIYRWTTCTDQSYDTQMTLYRGQAGKKCSLSGFACTKDSDCGTSETCDSYCGQQFLAYSDDTAESPCSSTNNKQTILEWKSDFGTVTTPGKVTLLVNQYNCGFCYQSPDYYNPWTHCPKTTVMMQRYDCYSCGTQKGSTNDFSDTVKTESSLVPGNYMKFNVKKGEKYRFKSTQQETGSTFSAILTLRKDNSTACAGETLAQSKLQDGSTYVQVIDFAAKEDMVVELLVSRSDVACSTTAYGKTATVTYEKLTSTYMTFEDNFVDDNGDQWTNVTRTSDGMIIYDQNKHMYTWEEAMEYCENLVYTIPSTSTDVEDWVLPNITELYSIVDFDLYDKATSFRLPSYVTNTAGEGGACTLDTQETDCGYPQYICGDELKCVRNNWYWTSTSVADSASFSWGINMKDGRSYRVLKSDIGVLVPATAHKVVCIRGDSVSGEFDPIRPAAERKFSGWACDKDKPDENVDIYFVIRKEVDDSGNGSNILNIGNYLIRGGSRIPNTFPTIYGFKYGETNKYPDETTKTAADKAVMTTKINSNCNNTATTVKHAFELDLSSSSGLAKTIKNAIDNEHADPVYSVTAYAGNGEKLPHKLRFKRLLFEKERFVLVDECGDGLISIGETCDDKNTVTEECAYNTPCNVCDSTCQWALGFVPKCRDGVVDALYEDCDCGSSSTYWIYDCSQTLPEKKCPGYGSGTCTICNEICSEEILNVPYCGDGTKDIHTDSTEECDDGNTIDNDGCVTGCKLPFCGDGFIFNTGPGANETCDDGSLNGAYANQCTPGPCCNETCDGDGPVCGDGILHRDDCPGAINYGDAGVWNTKPCIKIFGAAETCDAGADNGVWRDLAGHIADPGCNSTCSGEAPYCGDGDLQSVYELCDDGTDNQNDTYGKCRTDCSAKPRCGDGKWDGFGGDGLVTGPENCDDGIYNGSYGYCNNTCSGKVECGDQELDPAYEECEHKGNPQSYDPDIAFACNPDCTMGRYCGDGFLDNSRNVPLNNWTDPAAWSSHAGMTWDSNLEALKVVGYHETVLNVPVPIDTSKQYYMEYDVMTKNNSGKVLYSGTISYDSAMTQLSGHPGSYDYFVDSAITFTADTWYHRRNTFIGGLPRTGESANTNDRHMWHPGTAYAKVMFLFNYDGSSTQETYIKNLKFYTIEDGVTGLGDNELCDHGSANVEKDFATGYMVDCIATPTKNASGIYVYDKAYSCKWAHYCGDGLVDGPGGDGLVTGPEVCDDGALGNIGEYNKCNPGCLELGPRCGDGIVNGTEECDNNGTNSDAPGEPGVTCRTNCKWAKCGDNIQDTGEECDNGTANSNTTPNACRTNCTVSKCGDGVKDSTEECDDGDLNVTGIVAQYTFNETSSTIADDTSGNGYNGTIVGAHRYNIGRFGRAMEFDAVNDYVQIPNPLSSQPNLSQEWTVSAWVNIKNTGTDQFLISGMNLGVKLVHGAGDRMLLYVNSGTNDYYVYSNSAGLLTGQGWKHVVFVFRNSDGYRRIYVDGADKTGTGPNNTSTPSGISGTLRIGNLVNGLIDHVQIYNRAITPDEVTALYYLYGDSCNNCKNAKCGDGYQKIKDSTTGQFTAGILNEVCDDANVSNDDYCRNDCQAIIGFCGDGNIQNGSPASEECDSLGNPYCTGPCTGTGATMVCKPGCTLNHGNCGDGTRNYIAGEECDNGTNNDDLEGYCDTTCKVAGSCGDGEIQSKDESCDSAASTVAPGEGVGAYCINDCQTLLGNCGDGRIQGPGYTTSYYGGTLPTTPALWTTDGPEYCDTNDPRTISLTNTTGCNATTCTRDGSCGDGIRQSRFEGCDGSVTAGDSRLILRLDEKTGSTAIDDSGNGNNGTVYYWKENRVTYSQDFSNGIWNSYCGNKTNFTYNVFAPDMTNTAVKIVMPATLTCSGSLPGWGVLQSVSPALVAGGTYTMSVWLKGESGGESVGIGLNDGHMTTVTLTNEWKRYTATFTGITNITRGLQFRGAVAGQTYYAWGAQLQNRSKMSAYAETTSAPIAGSTSVYDGFGMWAKGKMGNALLFDGSKDYVVVPNNASMNPTSITVSMWLYLNQNPSCDANNNWRSVIRKGSTSGTTTGFDVVLEQSRVLVWDTGSGSSDRWNLGAAGTLPLNSWTHVVLVYDQTGSKKAYMNGNLIGTKSIAAAPLASNTDPLYISNSSSDCPNGAGAFPGFIDDVRIYSGALTPDQISKSIYDISQTCRAGCKSDPVGNLETALRTEISGWACDPDWPMRQARVVLEFTDRLGTRAYVTTPNDIMFTTFLSSEQSIQNICGGGANHRWSFNPALVNWTGLFQPFTVKAWALTEDVSPETDTLLGTKTFTMGPVCRDGVLEGDEECDDGNDVWADTCRNDCKVPKCGDTYDHDNNPATAEIPLVSSTETCEVGTTTSCVSA